MTGVAILAIVEGALTILEKAVPMLQSKLSQGEVTLKQQQDVAARIDRIRSGEAFKGPEWKKSTEV